jgi:outer membrane protein assembly factor BamA
MSCSTFRRLILAGAASFLLVLSVGPNVRCQRSRLFEEVRVIGNRRLTAKEILSHVKLKLGQPYSARQVQRDYQTILKLGWFDKLGTRVSIEDGVRGGAVVIFEVRDYR